MQQLTQASITILLKGHLKHVNLSSLSLRYKINYLKVLQLMIIWKALIEYLNNNLRSGKSVYIKKFGSFTFDIESELPKIASKAMSHASDLDDQRLTRKHIHNVK